jgi:hypothetical protein
MSVSEDIVVEARRVSGQSELFEGNGEKVQPKGGICGGRSTPLGLEGMAFNCSPPADLCRGRKNMSPKLTKL